MLPKEKKITPQRPHHYMYDVAAIAFSLLFCVWLASVFCAITGCLLPEAIKAKVHILSNDMEKLEKVVEQKAENTVVAEHVDQINNKIEQNAQIAEELSVWKKSVQAETINYGGAGWVVVGTGVMALIFIGAGLLLVRAFMKRGNMLSMLTRAVKNSGNDAVIAVKQNLKQCVHEGHCCDQDRKNLGDFAKKAGTFAERKVPSEV